MHVLKVFVQPRPTCRAQDLGVRVEFSNITCNNMCYSHINIQSKVKLFLILYWHKGGEARVLIILGVSRA